MKMNNYIRIVVILMLYIIKCINSSDEFNDYTACNKVDEETASREVCNAITVEMEDTASSSALEVTYALSIKDNKVQKIETVVDIEMVEMGLPATAKVTMTQNFEYEGSTKAKYTYIPSASKFE